MAVEWSYHLRWNWWKPRARSTRLRTVRSCYVSSTTYPNGSRWKPRNRGRPRTNTELKRSPILADSEQISYIPRHIRSTEIGIGWHVQQWVDRPRVNPEALGVCVKREQGWVDSINIWRRFDSIVLARRIALEKPNSINQAVYRKWWDEQL